ncbi:MAG: aminopeptidase P family protein [Phycisphaerales bacterium]|nr:aminopeptidase P family protein [Phycisphaerales bacterium]
MATQTAPAARLRRARSRRSGTARRSAAAAAQKAAVSGPFKDRLDAAARAAAGAAVSHLLVTDPLDVGYLTGFLGGDSYLLLGRGRPTIISDGRFAEELEPLSKTGLCRVHIRTSPMFDAVGEVVARAGIRRLGIQADHLTLSRRGFLAGRCKGVKLVETAGLIAGLRVVKDAHEVEQLVRAVRIQEESLEVALDRLGSLLRKGEPVTESRFAAVLEFEMKLRGSPAPSFETIVGSGPNGSLPHYRAGPALIKRGVPLLIDWGATLGGYHGDMTRVVCFGNWPREIAKVYEIVRIAHELAAANLAPGRSGKEIDAIAREHIAAAGYGERFAHSLGHGIGLQVHEDPRLSHLGAPVELREGMVVTVEPGVYLPGVGGVRLENDYLITRGGARNLCTLPMDMEWATRR